MDINRIQEAAFSSNGPVYGLMNAMVSVWQQEGREGHRGAPRVLMALLVRLAELSILCRQVFTLGFVHGLGMNTLAIFIPQNTRLIVATGTLHAATYLG